MDSVSRPEFHKIFDRISAYVDLKGATTAIAIENRMKIAIFMSKKQAESIKLIGDLKRTLRRELGRKASEFDKQIFRLKSGINRAIVRQTRYRAENINKLMEHDFAGRAIFEANIAPKGIIANTLRYGRKEALKRILAQKRVAVRAGRAGFKLRTPEFRAGLRGLR